MGEIKGKGRFFKTGKTPTGIPIMRGKTPESLWKNLKKNTGQRDRGGGGKKGVILKREKRVGLQRNWANQLLMNLMLGGKSRQERGKLESVEKKSAQTRKGELEMTSQTFYEGPGEQRLKKIKEKGEGPLPPK